MASREHDGQAPGALRASFRSPWVRVLGVAALAAVAAQLVVMVHWIDAGRSDFAMLYRTGEALNRQVDPALYASPDAPSNWVRSIGPFGMVIFRGLALLSPRAAGVLWAVLNVVFLCLGAACLAGTYRRLESGRPAFQRTFAWAVVLLAALSCGSLQTGQFSVLFVTCWLGWLWACARRRELLAGGLLAFPAAIKFYPLFLIAAPGSMGRKRQVAATLAATAVLLVGVSWAAYGSSALPLWSSYVRNGLLGSTQNAVTHRLNAIVLANQGLDVVLLRYLAEGVEPRPAIPHLNWPAPVVLGLAQAIRVLVVAATWFAARGWVRRNRHEPVTSAVTMLALWSAAMVLVLPEIKARYAVYALPAFLPLLAAADEARARGGPWGGIVRGVLLAACAAGLGALPSALRPYGLGLLAAAALWAANLACLRDDRPAVLPADIAFDRS